MSSRCCALGDGGAVAQSMYAVIREMDGALMDRAPRGAEMSGDFTKYNAAKKALAEAVRIDEVKDVHDKATAIWATQCRRQNKA